MAVWDEFVPPGELERLRANGFGEDVTVGDRPCLLVVDVTLSFISTDYPTGCGQVGRRGRLLRPLGVRARGEPVRHPAEVRVRRGHRPRPPN